MSLALGLENIFVKSGWVAKVRRTRSNNCYGQRFDTGRSRPFKMTLIKAIIQNYAELDYLPNSKLMGPPSTLQHFCTLHFTPVPDFV